MLTALTRATKHTKSKVNKRRLQKLRVAIEIASFDLRMVVVEDTDTERQVRAHTVVWRNDSRPLHSEAAIRDLTAGLRALVQKERLYGATVRVALSSDFCVTRVVAGENEEVRKELRSLEDRSSLYLLLGTGENQLATCVKPLDAKHQQAWVTVVNKRSMNAVLAAAEAAGVRLETVEHSLVALARAVGLLEKDRDQPVLVLEINHRGVDVGISYHGQLLIDYRPGGSSAKANIGEIVSRHLDRLQRFLNRRFRFATGKINHIFLCGDPEDVCTIREQFQSLKQFDAEVIDAQQVLARCDLPPANDAHPTFAPCIGLLSMDTSDPKHALSPNLMGDLISRVREPLWPTIGKVAWPIAAAIAITCAMFTATMYQKYQCACLDRELRAFAESRGRVARMQMEMGLTRQKLLSLTSINNQIRRPRWQELLAALHASRPDNVWLETIDVDGRGFIRLTGPSSEEQGIYEFLNRLKKQRILENVALEGTQLIQFNSEPATKFDITCNLADLNAATENTAQD